MDEAYIGAIVLFAGNFAPRGWAFCDGSILGIAQNSALFAILGATYGGNGQTTFALPDLRGRVAVSSGTGPGQPAVQLGQAAGSANVTLLTPNLPPHTHAQSYSTGTATSPTPTVGLSVAAANGTVDSSTDAVTVNIYGPATPAVPGGQTSPTGSGQPVSVMQPYLGLNYIICMQGIFPSRN